MPLVVPSLFQTSAVRAALACESGGMLPQLAGICGSHGLILDVIMQRPPSAPMVGCWVSLVWNETQLEGDLCCDAQGLPFADDSFRLVVLRHLAERTRDPLTLAAESMRVLAPGGLMLVTGFHPLSLWYPWLRRSARGAGEAWRTISPYWWRRQLRTLGGDVFSVRRCAPATPWQAARNGGDNPTIGGAYMLLARKSPRQAIPLRRSTSPGSSVRVGGAMARNPSRQCA